MKPKYALAWSFFLFSNMAFSQTLKQVEEIESQYQNRLDTGIGMLGTSKDYFYAVDSLLNVAYKNLRNGMTSSQKEELKSEQLKWLKKRDAYFNEVKAEYDAMVKSDGWGHDMFMTVYQQEAEFVKERVLYLMKRMAAR